MDQPSPATNQSTPVWDVVVADVLVRGVNQPLLMALSEDMRARDLAGRQRYGTPLQVGNGRDAMVDCYQELLDAMVYAMQAHIEGNSNKKLSAFWQTQYTLLFTMVCNVKAQLMGRLASGVQQAQAEVPVGLTRAQLEGMPEYTFSVPTALPGQMWKRNLNGTGKGDPQWAIGEYITGDAGMITIQWSPVEIID